MKAPIAPGYPGAKTRKRSAFTEAGEQRAFTTWFRAQYPRIPATASANGAHLSGDAKKRAMQIARLKQEGLQIGWPDWHIAAPRHGYAGLFLEFKRPDGKGRLTDAQKEVHAQLRAEGNRVEVVNTWTDARAIVVEYLSGLAPVAAYDAAEKVRR